MDCFVEKVKVWSSAAVDIYTPLTIPGGSAAIAT